MPFFHFFQVTQRVRQVLQSGLLLAVFIGISGCGNIQSPVTRPTVFKQGPILFLKLKMQANLIPEEVPIPLNRATTFKLQFWSEGQEGALKKFDQDPPLTPHVWLYMRMPSGAHGSAPVKVSPSLDVSGNPIPGVYEVSHLVFTMVGEWDIHIELINEDKKVIDEFVHIVQI